MSHRWIDTTCRLGCHQALFASSLALVRAYPVLKMLTPRKSIHPRWWHHGSSLSEESWYIFISLPVESTSLISCHHRVTKSRRTWRAKLHELFRPISFGHSLFMLPSFTMSLRRTLDDTFADDCSLPQVDPWIWPWANCVLHHRKKCFIFLQHLWDV